MRLLVTGSRDWTNEEIIGNVLWSYMDTEKIENLTLVHGGAKGADLLADEFFRRYSDQIEVFKADWDTNPRSGGVLRNLRMLDSCDPETDVVCAFVMPCSKPGCHRPDTHWSHGTWHCVEAAQRRGFTITRRLHPSLELRPPALEV